MKVNVMVSIAMCFLLLSACSSDKHVDYPTYVKEVAQGYEGYRLVWAEEFDKDGLPDPASWDYEEGYARNQELQDYRKADLKYSRVEDGKLILEVHEDPHEGINRWTGEPYHFEYSSASVMTKNKVPFERGRLDIAAKIPTGRGVWPAFWLLPVKNIYDGYAEIDLMEYVWGNDDKHESVYFTIHTQNTQDGVDKRPSSWTNSTSLDSNFHLYSIVWKKKSIEILFDNKLVLEYHKNGNSYKQWPFNQPFYLIMNIAVGGGWGGQWGIDEEMFPKQMEVEYVRYYELIEEEPDEEDQVENLIKNGGFEEKFAANKEPAIISPRVSGTTVLTHSERWFAERKNNSAVKIDNTIGVNGSVSSLKYTADKVETYWDVDLSYPFQDVSEGKYTLGFYLKTNQENTPFTVSITYCENEEEIAKEHKYQKTVVIKDGNQTTEVGVNDIWATMTDRAGTEWKKYTVTVDLPKCMLVKLVIKPCTTTTNMMNYQTTKTENVAYWFDDFSFEPVVE